MHRLALCSGRRTTPGSLKHIGPADRFLKLHEQLGHNKQIPRMDVGGTPHIAFLEAIELLGARRALSTARRQPRTPTSQTSSPNAEQSALQDLHVDQPLASDRLLVTRHSPFVPVRYGTCVPGPNIHAAILYFQLRSRAFCEACVHYQHHKTLIAETPPRAWTPYMPRHAASGQVRSCAGRLTGTRLSAMPCLMSRGAGGTQ